MATEAYVYVGNVKRWDGTVKFRFRSSEDNTIYDVPLGATINLNDVDLAKLDDRYILVPVGIAPGVAPAIRELDFIEEDPIPVGQVLTKTARGFEFEPPGGVSGTWKAPVDDVEGLPSSGNTSGDVRLAMAEGVLYYWDSVEWNALAGGGGGNGGEASFIDVPASLTGLDDGEILVWDSGDSRFEPGVL